MRTAAWTVPSAGGSQHKRGPGEWASRRGLSANPAVRIGGVGIGEDESEGDPDTSVRCNAASWMSHKDRVQVAGGPHAAGATAEQTPIPAVRLRRIISPSSSRSSGFPPCNRGQLVL
eukprot:scaffold21950_cov107-Isochrysis_galbana.AAC.3